MPNACANSSMSIMPMPTTSGLCRITYRPTQPVPSTRHSLPPKPGAFCGGCSSTTPLSTQVGSIWSRSRSASCAVSAWIAESTTQNGFAAKLPLGNDSEMPPAPASNGCSQPTKPAPKWVTHTPTLPKSHNHCAAVLASPASQRAQIGQALLQPPDVLPWVLLEPAQPLAHVEQRVLIAALGAAQLLPRHRRGDRRARAGPRRIRRNCRLLQRV